MIELIIVVIIVLFGSAICSASETALFSVSEIKVRQLAQSKTPAALALLEIRQRMNRPITTIVVLNNIFNIIGSIVIGGLAARVLGDALLGLFSAFLTFLIIVFGEIIPKTIGEIHGEKIAIIIAIPVKFLTIMFTPIVWVMEKIITPFSQGQKLPTTNEAEIRLLAGIGHKEGVIEDNEAEMIQRIFQLNDLTAADLMTPRVIITYIWGELTLAECKQEIISSQHTRILVIEDSIDNVLGICLKDELLTAMIEGKNQEQISTLIRPAQFVPETVSADKLLKKFQETHEHLMVVLDEYGGVSGVITLEDVLEVLTGEIVDETDKVIDLQQIAKKRRERLLQSLSFESDSTS